MPARNAALFAAIVAALLAFRTGAAAQTLPAAADNFPGVAIAALPYESLANTEDATVEPGEPLQPMSTATLWFHFTAANDGAIGVELHQDGVTGGSVTAYTGTKLADLTMVADGSTSSTGQWAAVFRVKAGVTYYLQVASNQFDPPYAAKLTLRLAAGSPPANDLFPGPAITTLPFSDVVDTAFATVDAGEPSLLGGTVWYSFTGPAGGATMQADILATSFASGFAVKDAETRDIPGAGRGTTVQCGTAQVTVFYVRAGETVWIQAGSQGFPGPRGQLSFHLRQVDASTVALCPGDQPPFNYDVVKEVVVPLIGDDGRTHYVTMIQDTAGVVRIRLSLFNFQPGRYNVIIRQRAACDDSGGLVGQLKPPLSLDADSASYLVLTFWNTDLVSLTPGAPNSIYDADGAALAVYRPGSGGSGLRAACAILSGPPGAPGTGTGLRHADPGAFPWPLAAGVAFAFAASAAVAGWAGARRRP
jgi:hypothetical protein